MNYYSIQIDGKEIGTCTKSDIRYHAAKIAGGKLWGLSHGAVGIEVVADYTTLAVFVEI